MDIRRIATIKEGQDMVGNRTKVKVVKNKMAPPFRDAEFDIMYSLGISMEGDVLDQAVNHNLVQKSGTWFSYGETRLGQGRENAKRYLMEDEKMLREIETKVRELLGLSETKTETPKNEAEAKSAEIKVSEDKVESPL
jgi:recombination protein RecA